MSQKRNRTTASGRTAKQAIEARLEAIGIDATRAVDVSDGEKVCYDHDKRRKPSEWDGNYGIYATAADSLVILDIDEYRDLTDGHAGVDALKGLPETLTQQSPHGGEHRLYYVPVTDSGRFPSAVFEDEFGQNNPVPEWGEVQVANKYILGAGSELDSCGKEWHDCSENGEGSYELLNDAEIATVEADQMVEILLSDPEIEAATPTPDVGGPSSSAGGDVDLSVHDVLFASSYPEGKRTEHPVHGSSTGTNFAVDEDADTWRCWRHGVTGNAMHLIGMQEGVIECGEWESSGLSSEMWADIFAAAREAGYDIGDPPEHGPKGLDVAEGYNSADVDVETDGGTTQSVADRVRHEVLIPFEGGDDVDEITEGTAIDRTARIFDDEFSFIMPRDDVQDWGCVLHYYDEELGIYDRHGPGEVNNRAEKVWGDFATNKRVNELVAKLKRRNYVTNRDLHDPHVGRLVVKNGILDLRTGELDTHTPDEYHQVRLPVAYDPDATCPEIDSFFNDIVEDGDVPTLFRTVAHTLWKQYRPEKAIMMVGDGQNGKSVFLSLLEEFLGQRNTAGRSLQELSESQFAMNNLHKKMANLHPDMSDESVDDISKFKQLTGGDTVTADVKYAKPINFESHATMIFSANGVPRLPEDNHAVWRRWVYLSFPYTFDGESAVPKRVLMRQLTDQSELQGLLARCVEEIGEWWDGRDWFADAPSPEETRRMLKRASDPVFDFATTCLREAEEEEAYVTAEKVQEAYRTYARDEGLPIKSDSVLGERLNNIRDLPIETGRTRLATSGSTRDPVYWGVELTQRGRQALGSDVDPSQPSLDDDRDDDLNPNASDSTESDSSSGESSEPESEADAESGDENGTATVENTGGDQSPAYTGQQYSAAMNYLIAHQQEDGSVPDWVCGASLYEDCPDAFAEIDVAETAWQDVEESLGMSDTEGDN